MLGKLISRACEALARMTQPTPAATFATIEPVEHAPLSQYLPLPTPVVVAAPVLTQISASSDNFVPFARVKTIKPRFLSSTLPLEALLKVPSTAREPSLVAAQQDPLDTADVPVSPPARPTTPPPSPTSSVPSPPDSPSSHSDVSFTFVSTAPTEPAPQIFSEAYFIKLYAAAEFIKLQGALLDNPVKCAEAYAHALALVEAEEAHERRYNEASERYPPKELKERESDEVRHARMKARIESALCDFLVALYPMPPSVSQRSAFRPLEWSMKVDAYSTVSYPISSRAEPEADSVQSLARLRVAAKRPQSAARYRRSATHSYLIQAAASHGAGSFARLRHSAILANAYRVDFAAREAMPVVASSTLEQELESLPESPVAPEPSPKRWSDYDETDDEVFLATPLVFGAEPVVEDKQPAGPTTAPVKLLWSELVDSPDDDYFASPPVFGDEDKVEPVIEAEQPAGPAAASVNPLWSELVDSPDDDYFATPPLFGDEGEIKVSVDAEQPARPPAPAPLRWSDLVDLPDDDDEYFASPPVF